MGFSKTIECVFNMVEKESIIEDPNLAKVQQEQPITFTIRNKK